jgi:hypothetical protein
MSDPLAPQIVRGLPVQFGIDDGHQRFDGILLSEAPFMEPQSDLGALIDRLVHSSSNFIARWIRGSEVRNNYFIKTDKLLVKSLALFPASVALTIEGQKCL